MIATTSPAELLRLTTLRDALKSPGPCITIFLSPYRPGEQAGSPAALLKTNCQEAARQLALRSFPKGGSIDLLQPLESLAADPQFAAGSHWGRAIFRSPSVFRQFHLTRAVPPGLSVGGCFSIRPLASELARSAVFYILVLSQTRVRLLRCAGFHCELIKLPKGVPETLTEALALEPPDHDLENRSSAGSSTGRMRGVRFGTGSGREREHAHLADFYKLVDRGIQELLHEPDTPLILAGVQEETAAFRAISTYPELATTCIAGSPEPPLPQERMLEQAYCILRDRDLERQARALRIAIERTAPRRVAKDPDVVLRAAFEGRIGELYVNETAEKIEMFERGKYESWGNEDLFNLAAVQTIIHQGNARVLPAEMMPEGAAMIGILRY